MRGKRLKIKNRLKFTIILLVVFAIAVSGIGGMFALTGFFGGSGSESADLTRGLVGHWKFDDGVGVSAIDSSGNGNTGTLTNNPQWIPGVAEVTNGGAGTALQFDGVDDFILITGRVQVSNEASFSFWLEPNELKTSYILSKRIKSFDNLLNDWQLGMDDASGAFLTRLWGTSDDIHKTGSGFLITGEWAYITVVYDGAKVEMF